MSISMIWIKGTLLGHFGNVGVLMVCRDDCALVDVPAGCVAYVTGSKGASLRRVEELSNTFIFFDGDR